MQSEKIVNKPLTMHSYHNFSFFYLSANIFAEDNTPALIIKCSRNMPTFAKQKVKSVVQIYFIKKIVSLLLVMVVANTFALAKISAQQKIKNKNSIYLHLRHYQNEKPLILNETAINSYGEKMVITNFQYYISNVQFGNKITTTLPINYYLITAPTTGEVVIQVPCTTKTPTQISFTLGVDSAANCSGAQTGALDPLHGMFWTWQTGYIMAKLEGTSPLSKAYKNAITYHIGGYMGQYATQRNVTLQYNASNVRKHRRAKHLTINVDISKWYNGVHPLPITTHNYTMSIGKVATQYADNYAEMFSIAKPIQSK